MPFEPLWDLLLPLTGAAIGAFGLKLTYIMHFLQLAPVKVRRPKALCDACETLSWPVRCTDFALSTKDTFWEAHRHMQ